MRILWSESARNDLRQIHAFIARDSRVYAKNVVDRIKKKVDLRRRFPALGGAVEVWNREDFRELIVGNYRVIYRIDDAVRILTVLHGARRLPDVDGINGENRD